MFTNERLLVIIIVVLILGASGYFVFTKFKQEATSSSSPSPTPDLKFVLQLQTPAPSEIPSPQSGVSRPQTVAKPSVTTQNPTQNPELPLSKNKKLSQFPGILAEDVLKNKKAVILMLKGNIEIEIFPDAPKAASNFLLLASNGFYDGLKFHRVEKGFVVQGGDPLGDGTGGPGYAFEDEPVTKDYLKGIVAYANAGPNTNGSQFFIMVEGHPELPKNYTIFGKVISGMEVVEKIEVGDVMQKILITNLFP